jgi:hypothetical protein
MEALGDVAARLNRGLDVCFGGKRRRERQCGGGEHPQTHAQSLGE